MGSDALKATCSSGINVRWARSFGTSEEAEDTQLSVDHADVAYPAFSFFYEWSDADHTAAPVSATYNWHPTSVEMTPVTMAGVEAQDAELAAQPEVTESTIVGWLYENQWVIGILFAIVGPLLAFLGTKWFFFLMTALGAIVTMELVIGVSLACGGMDGKTGSILTCCIALVLGLLSVCLLMRSQKLMLGILGFACGFYSGVFLFSIICWCTGGKWNAVWGYYLFAGIFGVTGAIRGIQRGKLIVMIFSSIVGSYLTMRALTLFFPGNYPSEVELIHS